MLFVGQSTTVQCSMSGRDLRSFLSCHRGGTFNLSNKEEHLTSAYLSGSHGNKRFKKVDYEALLSTASHRRATGKDQMRRMKELSKQSKRSKESSLLKKHHEVWDTEHEKLLEARKRVQAELELWKTDAFKDEGLKSFIVDVVDYKSSLCQERDEFESNTVEPIWSLRIDLKGWVNERACPESDQSLPSFESVLNELESVKDQQSRIQQLLEDEYDMIWSELSEFISRLPSNIDEPVISRGVPTVVQDLECPDERLKMACFEEFDKLDSHYKTLMDERESEHCHVISSSHGGWREIDAERFAAILDQYPPSLANRRKLYIDRLIREFPHKTREEIVSHETWFNARNHYLNQTRSYLRSWQRSRSELCDYVRTIFQESKQAYDEMQLARLKREEQTELCRQLSEKVCKWREEKLIQAQLAAEAEEQREAEREELRLLEENRQFKHRQNIRHKIELFHLKLEQQQEQERTVAKATEAAAESAKRQRLRTGVKRVAYRQELLGAKEEERRQMSEAARLEEEEREKRLALLRQQVQVNVSTDPLRVLRETKATKARSTIDDTPSELHLKQPLFQVNSFTADKVTSDLRVRMEAALREAGLHTTTYARKILATVPPPRPPRPDQKSSLFKS